MNAVLPDIAEAVLGVKRKPAPKRARKTVTRLFVTDALDRGLVQSAPSYARQVVGFTEKEVKESVKTVRSWEELAALLDRYERIDELVLFFHGRPDDIQIGGPNADFKPLMTLKPLLKQPPPTVAKEINLEGCNLALGAKQAVEFGQLFRAPKVIAYTQFHIMQKQTLTVPRGATAADVENLLNRQWGRNYLLPDTNFTAKSKPGTHEIFLEWFRDDLVRDPLPPVGDVTPDPRNKIFKQRRDMKARQVTAEEAATLAEEYRRMPTRPHERVTITLP